MELIHVEESFKIFMNESEIVSKNRSEKKIFKRFEYCQICNQKNDETLNM
jgi:hypothetical protein